MSFSQEYGPWALVLGASDGVGQRFAEALAERGLNVVLLARREPLLNSLAADIEQRYGVQTRVLALDLSRDDAAQTVIDELTALDIGFLVFCAGAEPAYRAFLDTPLDDIEAMVHRNCSVMLQLCHHFCAPMVERGRGAVVIFGSGAAFAGAKNLATYSATKAFDMLFAEGLWCELNPKGIDVLGLILGETDTPALRKLRYEQGLATLPDEPVTRAATADYVVDDALAHLKKGPTRMANRTMRWGLKLFYPFSRNFMVSLMAKASERTIGGGS